MAGHWGPGKDLPVSRGYKLYQILLIILLVAILATIIFPTIAGNIQLDQ